MSEHTSTPTLGGQFAKALVYAEVLHHNQVRKGGGAPYIGHLLNVAGLVINDGGTEAQAIAALLHDAVEDTTATVEDIRANFGDDVARMVAECSDTDVRPKPPWRQRKEAHIAHLNTAGADTLLVSVADKLDNARSLLRDYREIGPPLWQRFTVTDPAEHLWYFAELLALYRRRGLTSWMVDELERVVGELKRLIDGQERVVLV
ncbi:MAG: HD domain-containing protein [Mycolicibacterium hassiacum]|jgi:(p)ppGpp synthase/HD superfamily hydrolase|uniref:HD domain-containing protein n=1 Tax=Mycolicibacterium hassiacum TaxID=46351 RepID=UPI000DB0FED1|nr:HD domain-containing protein [Mycolicibacterium hassiacum]MBX5487544.1 HD domain-containing protein [Mycolicibacterium hassiacum]PZN18257.1 MAG: phosphohydrolase [Mycolicibacterium hassiacum]